MSRYVIETEGLRKRFGQKVSVDGLDLRVPKGVVYGFLGPNGAGKTTTIRMLLGLMRPTEGRIRLFGMDPGEHRRTVLRRIGSLVETPTVYGHLTGYQNLKVMATLLGVPERRIGDVLEQVRLEKNAHRRAGTYSLGMKQRLGIAAALLGEPELLILDEPTNGLDPAGMQEMRELIRELPKESGTTVFVSSHLLGEVEQIATHAGIIADGRLVFQGSLDELRARGNGRLEIETDRPEEAETVLKRRGWSVRRDGGCLCADETDREQTAAMVRVLVESGHSVYRVASAGKNLEHLFIELTGRGNSL
ncbi:ABC transporter ATP-binding protein [Staphylospora marina]|uniref:ABC transporter ATP-binding protein n=1 Tax=Staphylospora marina TaxID=2490858 RepID=UPI000F5C2706|nr:ABC transporter ATP-binding protein [Staphylospora marina]